MGVIVGEMVDHARTPRMDVSTAKILRRDHLAGRRLHQRRAAQEDRALVLHDDGLVRHGRDIRPAGRARAHHSGDLGDPLCRQVRLVEEDPAEVLAIGEDLVLHRQERATGVDEVGTRQPVGPRDLLRTQVFLHRHRIVRAALDGRVVGDDHALAAADPTDPGHQTRRRDGVVVHAGGRERGQLQKWAAGIQQPVDSVPYQQLAPGGVPVARLLRSALADDRQSLA